MKLGVLFDRLRPGAGGAERNTAALLARAVAQGDDAVLATLEGEAPAGVQTLVVKAPRPRPLRDQVFADNGEKALRDAGCDVVLAIRHALRCDVYQPRGGLVGDTQAAWDEARGGVSSWRQIARNFSAKRHFFQEAEEAMLGGEQGPLVLALSKQLAQRIAAVYPHAKARTRVIPNGVDTAFFDRGPHEDAARALRATHGLEGAYVALHLATHPVLKGLAEVLEALSRPEVREVEAPLHVVLAGHTPGRALRRVLRRHPQRDRIHAVGPVADPRPWYAAADVLVHPTWYDPCSAACLEALAMELPVITTPRNGVRELMGMRGGIVLEEPGNAEALAVALRVLGDEHLRAVTADDARYVAQCHRLETRMDQVLDACRNARGP